jgi:hypothetical protein
LSARYDGDGGGSPGAGDAGVTIVGDESLPEIGMVGPFWVVESDGRIDIIALTVSLKMRNLMETC